MDAETRHDGVQIQNTETLAGHFVQKHVVQHGIVAGDSQGDSAGFRHVVNENVLISEVILKSVGDMTVSETQTDTG